MQIFDKNVNFCKYFKSVKSSLIKSVSCKYEIWVKVKRHILNVLSKYNGNRQISDILCVELTVGLRVALEESSRGVRYIVGSSCGEHEILGFQVWYAHVKHFGGATAKVRGSSKYYDSTLGTMNIHDNCNGNVVAIVMQNQCPACYFLIFHTAVTQPVGI